MVEQLFTVLASKKVPEMVPRQFSVSDKLTPEQLSLPQSSLQVLVLVLVKVVGLQALQALQAEIYGPHSVQPETDERQSYVCVQLPQL